MAGRCVSKAKVRDGMRLILRSGKRLLPLAVPIEPA